MESKLNLYWQTALLDAQLLFLSLQFYFNQLLERASSFIKISNVKKKEKDYVNKSVLFFSLIYFLIRNKYLIISCIPYLRISCIIKWNWLEWYY